MSNNTKSFFVLSFTLPTLQNLYAAQIYQICETMPIEGYVEYKSREFCNDVRCPVQLELNSKKQGSEGYEKIRQTCKTNCKHTAREFHYWLIGRGYLIVKPEK